MQRNLLSDYIPGIYLLCGLLFFSNFKCHPNMEKDFCQALIDNDRKALQPVVDAYLKTLDAKDNLDSNNQKIKEWIQRHSCVDAVEISSMLLSSDPLIQNFYITLKTETSEQRSIGIKLLEDKYLFSYR